MTETFNVTKDATMLENYGFNPLEITPKDGFWSYQFKSNSDETLMISFNTFERWIKVSVSTIGRNNNITMLVEKATSLRVVDSPSEAIYLIGEGEGDMVFTLTFSPKITLSFTANENR